MRLFVHARGHATYRRLLIVATLIGLGLELEVRLAIFAALAQRLREYVGKQASA